MDATPDVAVKRMNGANLPMEENMVWKSPVPGPPRMMRLLLRLLVVVVGGILTLEMLEKSVLETSPLSSCMDLFEVTIHVMHFT